MFYQCPKCKNIWQYPIEKCPNCFLEMERLLTKTARVIGISKVNIPTLLHPKAPYFVLVLEDEKGNKWAHKSWQEYKIGEMFKVEPCADKNAVAIWRIKYDILEAIEKAVELLGGLEINSQTKILILPTLIAPKHPYFAVNTNPKFLESLIRYLIEIGGDVKNIKVAAQSFDETPIEVSVQKSQLLDVCLQHQIAPLDLAKGNFVKKEINGCRFEISEEVFRSDLIINLPILKVGKISAAENLFKFLKKENYLSFSDEEIIEKLLRTLPERLTIADGLTVQKTDGLTVFLGLTLASYNPLNLDRVFAEITTIKELPECLKKIKIEDIPIAGRKVEELQYKVEKYG